MRNVLIEIKIFLQNLFLTQSLFWKSISILFLKFGTPNYMFHKGQIAPLDPHPTRQPCCSTKFNTLQPLMCMNSIVFYISFAKNEGGGGGGGGGCNQT